MYERLKPIFADVDEFLCLDPKSIEERITPKTKAIMFVGMGGNAGKLREIKYICEKHNLKLILDAAHMSGTKIKNIFDGMGYSVEHVGKEADVTIFSFQAVKNLPTEKQLQYLKDLGYTGVVKTKKEASKKISELKEMNE